MLQHHGALPVPLCSWHAQGLRLRALHWQCQWASRNHGPAGPEPGPRGVHEAPRLPLPQVASTRDPWSPATSAAGAAAPAAAADSFFWKACLSISKSSRLGPRPAQPPAKLRSAPHSCELELDVSGPKFTRTHRSHFITQQVPATTACLILRLDRSLYRAAGRQPRFRRRQQRSP